MRILEHGKSCSCYLLSTIRRFANISSRIQHFSLTVYYKEATQIIMDACVSSLLNTALRCFEEEKSYILLEVNRIFQPQRTLYPGIR